MDFLKGIRFSTFVSTYQEWHACVIGFCEVLCPWPPRVRIPSPSMREGQGEGDKLNRTIHAEYHYYMFGRAIGVIAWLIIAPITIGIIGKIIQEVFS